MKFYQYWLLVITILLVAITVYNISKTIIIFSKNMEKRNVSQNKDLNNSIVNLLLSTALLSIISLLFIILAFN